jgi:class 3 adenylate cyclase
MDELNVDAIETALAARGLLPSRPDDPPAIVFADLAGYTRLTEELGDEGAAGVALRLAELALETAGRRGGRLVKLLGDGVMLQFARPRAAVEAALDLVGAVEAAGLPVAHVGIDAGRVIARDGDFFGRTVILASRLSGAAGPGEVLVSSSVVAAVAAADAADPVSHRPLTFGPLGTIHLKGITDPVEVHRVAR